LAMPSGRFIVKLLSPDLIFCHNGLENPEFEVSFSSLCLSLSLS
jgi:hypothetical protein